MTPGESVWFYHVGQGIKSTTAVKADHAVFMNGLPKVSTVVSKLLARH